MVIAKATMPWAFVLLSSPLGCCTLRVAAAAAPASPPRATPERASSTAAPVNEPAPRSVASTPSQASANDKLPLFPTRITTQAPRLGRDLDPTTPLLAHFTATPIERQAHLVAARLIDAVRDGLRGRRWNRETRTGCAVEADGNAFVEGRLLIRDESNRVRAFSETIGSGDSAAFWKLYYDDHSVLRTAIFSWKSYAGQKADGVMTFSDSGKLIRCSSLPGDAGIIFCGALQDPTETLAPEVAAATQPSAAELPDSVRWAMARDPVSELAKCDTPYHPTP
jgi:hypothetical protein